MTTPFAHAHSYAPNGLKWKLYMTSFQNEIITIGEYSNLLEIKSLWFRLLIDKYLIYRVQRVENLLPTQRYLHDHVNIDNKLLNLQLTEISEDECDEYENKQNMSIYIGQFQDLCCFASQSIIVNNNNIDCIDLQITKFYENSYFDEKIDNIRLYIDHNWSKLISHHKNYLYINQKHNDNSKHDIDLYITMLIKCWKECYKLGLFSNSHDLTDRNIQSLVNKIFAQSGCIIDPLNPLN